MAFHEEPSDNQLMARLKSGDTEALRALYERHARSLYNFARRLLMDPAAAEDVLQETFLRVYKGRAAFRPVATFKTWAFTPAAVGLLGVLGLAHWVGYLDYVLFPLLAIFLVAVGYGYWRRRQMERDFPKSG